MSIEPFRIKDESETRKYVHQESGHCIWLMYRDDQYIVGQPVIHGVLGKGGEYWFVPHGQLDAFLAAHP